MKWHWPSHAACHPVTSAFPSVVLPPGDPAPPVSTPMRLTRSMSV